MDFIEEISGKMLDSEEDSTEDHMTKVDALKVEKQKLKGEITGQLSELAGWVAGVSSDNEPRSSEEYKKLKLLWIIWKRLRKKLLKYWKS